MPPRIEHVRAKPSLRARLGRHVLLPLAATWGLGSIVVLAVGGHFAAQAFDRALLDDAYALAAHVHTKGVELALNLTPQEMSTLLFDQDGRSTSPCSGPAADSLPATRGYRPRAFPKARPSNSRKCFSRALGCAA
jgi:two-component system sensor histidine kinase TctE